MGPLGPPEGRLEPGSVPGGSFRPSPGLPFLPLCDGWIGLGPKNITCVITALAAHPVDTRRLYAGAEHGGVWKTADGGLHWVPTMDRELNLNVGALGLCRSRPDTLYAGMNGAERGTNLDVYRSEDGALSWDRAFPVPSSSVRALAVHPGDWRVVYLAGDRSLHKSTDGGATWMVANATVDGVVRTNWAGVFDGSIDDLGMDVDHPDTLYIAVGQQGLFKTTDGGATWNRLGAGASFEVDDGGPRTVGFDGSYRTLLALGEDRRPGRNGTSFVAAKVQGTILVSTDGGATWRALPGTDHGLDDQNWWDSCIAVCPTDQDFIVAGGDHIDMTLNGSAANPTWTPLNSIHVDQQAIAFSPAAPADFYFANDGAIGKATGRGSSTSKISDGLVAGQCFNVAVSQSPTLVVGGSTYHTGIVRTGRVSLSTWEIIDCCEGGLFEIHPTDERTLFDSPWGASLRRSKDGGSTWTPLSGMIDVGGGGRESYVGLLGIRPDTPDELYASAFYGRLHFSRNGGDAWDYVKRADGTPLLIDGADLRESGASAIGYAPTDGRYCYLGTSTGRLWRTTNAGTTAADWERVLSLPVSASINAVAVDPSNPDRIFVGFGAVGQRSVWRGVRTGAAAFAWTDVSGLYPSTSLPKFPVTSLVVDPDDGRRVFASTTVGVFTTEDGGDWWRPFDEGLPNCSIPQMRFRARTRTLYATAYGRGIFQRAV